jgi:hypothetical protein
VTHDVSNATEPSEPEEVDIDEEKVQQDSNSDFESGSEESDVVESVRGEEIDEDCGEAAGMWVNVASVRNSEDFGVKPGLEYPSINDSVSLMVF